jgi:hypothetical protein
MGKDASRLSDSGFNVQGLKSPKQIISRGFVADFLG